MIVSSEEICCDLLENYYLCSINNSCEGPRGGDGCVVICLKTTTFVVSTTVKTKTPSVQILL